MSALVVALVPLAAGAGAACRYAVDQLVLRRHAPRFPWGTWAVNVSGAFALGLLVAVGEGGVVTVAGGGFLGSYTTFSTFAWQIVRQVEDGALGAAAGNAAASLAAGLSAVTAGFTLGSLF